MLSPMGVRGSSDAIRVLEDDLHPSPVGLQARAVELGDVARRRTGSCPDVGSISRSSSRPTVVLPQPDSPTRPERLAPPDLEDDAVDRLHLTDGPLQDAALDREVLHEVADLDQRYDARRRRMGGGRSRLGGPGRRHAIGPRALTMVADPRARTVSRRTSDARRRGSAAAAWPELQESALRVVVEPAADVVAGRHRRGARVDLGRRSRRRARSRAAQRARTGSPSGRSMRLGTLPGMTASSSWTSPDDRDRADEPLGVRMQRLAGRASRRPSARRSRPRTSRPPDRTSRRRRRGRG